MRGPVARALQVPVILYEASDWDESMEELEAMMSEDVVGENHGSSAGRLVYKAEEGHDGERAPSPRRSLNSSARAARQFASGGGVQIVHRPDLSLHGAHGYDTPRQVLSKEEQAWVDMDGVRGEALELLGITADELDRLNNARGRLGPEMRALQARLDARLLELRESGASMITLAKVLGWPIVGPADVPRLRKAYKRARMARDPIGPAQAQLERKERQRLHRIAERQRREEQAAEAASAVSR